uniref:Uncharacterized protein n=1 Tax=Chromera velia CCMP2878 TaxID=1169474 RepID=A0A0G4HAN0_9ALVE|eukprot:Cvel_6065.t1-p1 / transcript=Cvel_6065.t1 / gene=Cvel_6065 / organism=Chromera_velia_CCMP2878 / gene_product=hypothetical protein / transcript_product=hypothetical protein / location=Cvel_scaffold291:102239-104396(-) / protein_length=487 / sequence_SO=supercontig / SO=protein_coding / is_pseudo=false
MSESYDTKSSGEGGGMLFVPLDAVKKMVAVHKINLAQMQSRCDQALQKLSLANSQLQQQQQGEQGGGGLHGGGGGPPPRGFRLDQSRDHRGGEGRRPGGPMGGWRSHGEGGHSRGGWPSRQGSGGSGLPPPSSSRGIPGNSPPLRSPGYHEEPPPSGRPPWASSHEASPLDERERGGRPPRMELDRERERKTDSWRTQPRQSPQYPQTHGEFAGASADPGAPPSRRAWAPRGPSGSSVPSASPTSASPSSFLPPSGGVRFSHRPEGFIFREDSGQSVTTPQIAPRQLNPPPQPKLSTLQEYPERRGAPAGAGAHPLPLEIPPAGFADDSTIPSFEDHHVGGRDERRAHPEYFPPAARIGGGDPSPHAPMQPGGGYPMPQQSLPHEQQQPFQERGGRLQPPQPQPPGAPSSRGGPDDLLKEGSFALAIADHAPMGRLDVPLVLGAKVQVHAIESDASEWVWATVFGPTPSDPSSVGWVPRCSLRALPE